MKTTKYNFIFNDLYNDFKKETLITKYKRKYVFTFILTSLIFIILTNIIINIFNLNSILCNIITTIIILIYYLVLFLYLNHNFKINSDKYINNYYNELNNLLKRKKYKNLNCLTKLNELESFLLQYQSTLLLEKINNNSNSIFKNFSLFIAGIGTSYVFNSLLDSTTNTEQLIVIGSLIFIITIISYSIYQVIEIYKSLKNKDDELYINLLLTLIRERKLEIIDSKNKNIITKIKFYLKEDEFS